ncbi:hypothetical protein AO715_01490 [Xanthomonas sp. Mitacek01]|nr:hypothetical protein AO715_01490 [Xanthomonas sp. Mitacek01]
MGGQRGSPMQRLFALGFFTLAVVAALAYAACTLARMKVHFDATCLHPRALRAVFARAHRRAVGGQRVAMTTALVAAAGALACCWPFAD